MVRRARFPLIGVGNEVYRLPVRCTPTHISSRESEPCHSERMAHKEETDTEAERQIPEETNEDDAGGSGKFSRTNNRVTLGEASTPTGAGAGSTRVYEASKVTKIIIRSSKRLCRVERWCIQR